MGENGGNCGNVNVKDTNVTLGLQCTLYYRVNSHCVLSASGTAFILLPYRSLAPEPDIEA